MIERHDAHVAAWAKHHARLFARKQIADGFKPVALHKYDDADGLPLYWKIRLKHANGSKWIRPMMRRGSGFGLGEPEFPNGKKPLYRLHELAARQDSVYVAEGETCADALAAVGILATTSGGADSADAADWTPLAGRAITIWPDNDDAGQRYASAVAAKLLALGCVVRIIDVAALNLPPKGDVADWLAAHTKATVADLAGLPTVESIEHTSEPPTGDHARDVNLIRASEVIPEPITWLWADWLAAGKVHIFGGAPGTGKTTIAMALAAAVTTGGRWPDGTRSSLGNVVIWSGEDDPADTLIPRLALSGADLSRVYFITDIQEGIERRSFDPAHDMEPLRRKLNAIGEVRLLIVDPIVSAIAGDSHKNSEVRRGLQPLADLAASMRCALLGITHFSKGTGGRDPVERLTGSLAFGALARVVLVAAKHQEEGDDGRTVRLFCRAKSNIGPDDGGFEYDLHQAELKTHPGIFASSVLWGEAVEGAARELLATADATGSDGEGGTLADAKRFLSDLLAEGPMPTKAIKADADGAGYSWATIRRAQKALGIEPTKEGGHFGATRQQWLWRLPAEHAQREHLQDESLKMLKNAEDAQQKEVSTFMEIEHLQDGTDLMEGEL